MHAVSDSEEMPSSRQRIVAAARSLFGSEGFHSTSMAELAAAANVSVGLIYRFFPGKDDIIVAIVEEDVRERMAVMEEIFAGIASKTLSAFDGIEAFVRLSMTSGHASLHAEMVAEAYRNPRVAERIDEFSTLCRAATVQLATLLQPVDDPQQQEARITFMNACAMGLEHYRMHSTRLDVDDACRRIARLIMHALNAPAG